MFKRIILISILGLLIICPGTSFAWHDYVDGGDWNYYGSGRDHPYSAYIDRHYYVGPQGEYYPEFPKIFQLQMMYGK